VMVLGRGELGSSRCMGEGHGPTARSYDPALAQQPGILFSILARDASPIRQTPLPVLAQLAIGCSNPLSIFWKHSLWAHYSNLIVATRC